MVTLTKEDLDILKAPFKATEHEFLRGFVYITEFAIVTRIEKVDPAWEFEITALDSRHAVGTSNQMQVTCTAALTIKGVTRYGVGQAKAYETKPYTDKETGETKPTEEANEAEKSAATDALKRAARLFGIGRYLLMLPKNIKNEKQLGDWIQRALEAKAKAEGFQGDAAYAQMEQMAKDYLLTGDERILTGDPEGKQPRNDRAALLRSIDETADKHGYGEPDPHDYDDGETSYDDELPEAGEPPKERYTTPTNLVVTKMGKGDKLYMVIEGCPFWSREAFRLLYDDDVALIQSLGTVGVTQLPDTVTVVYVYGGDFKKPVSIKRNSTNATVDVTKKPVLLPDSEKV